MSIKTIGRHLGLPVFHVLMILVLSLFIVSFIVLAAGVSPFTAFSLLYQGSLGSVSHLGHVMKSFFPMTLCAMGLVYTYRISLWNIGIEGQVIVGALSAMVLFRLFPEPQVPSLFFSLGIVSAFLGGMGWAMITGFLKSTCGVNEIFAGLGMNFVSQGLALWLIFGPWKRPGIASMSGTDPIADVYCLIESGPLSISGFELILVFILFIFTWILIRKSIVGLKLHASGSNPFASRLLGLQPTLSIHLALAVCGGFAGLAGLFQVSGVYHRLIPSISSNYGYLAILVVLLSGFDIRIVPIISFFFSCLLVGSIQLPMMLQIDSSLSGVVQGIVVMVYLVYMGIARHLNSRIRKPVYE